jgi:hypothetical protein
MSEVKEDSDSIELKKNLDNGDSNSKLGSKQIENNADNGLQDDHENTESSDSSTDENIEYNHMPLLKYRRLRRSFFQRSKNQDVHSLSSRRTCSTMGRVLIRPTKSVDRSTNISDPNEFSSDSLNFSNTVLIGPKAFYITASAFQDGSIRLVESESGLDIDSDTLKMNPTNMKKKRGEIVALSFDSTSKFLAAITAGGDVAIFELHFGLAQSVANTNVDGHITSAEHDQQISSNVQSQHQQSRAQTSLFGNFLSRIAGDDRADEESSSNVEPLNHPPETQSSVQEKKDLSMSASPRNEKKSDVELPRERDMQSLLRLTKPVSVARFSYTIGIEHRVICMVLDPGYSRKRDKIIFVGFSNGTLTQTKRDKHGGVIFDSKGFGGVVGSWLQPKRQDYDIHVAPGGEIEAVTCRGSTLAWADCDGIKLFDIDRMYRLAKIDKPTGARSTLYPHISSLRPSLLFERQESLLIVWGDCILNMVLKEEKSENIPSGTKHGCHIQVKCEMAYELDCVGCDIQPMDGDYLAVIGLSSVISDDASNGLEEDQAQMPSSYLVELQIIRRSSGAVISSDILPLAVKDKQVMLRPCTSEYKFLSSFSTPRMLDILEAQVDETEYEMEEPISIDINQLVLSTMNQSINEISPKKIFKPQHLKWNIDEYRRNILDQGLDSVSSDDGSATSSESSDSDDYTFLFRAQCDPSRPVSMLTNLPTMIINSPDDSILVQIQDVDDAINFAKENRNFGMALKYGLRHRQFIRRNRLDDLINLFLHAILYSGMSHKDNDNVNHPKALTLRRLKIAAKATPILLGGNISLWEQWVNEFSRIPGGLLLLRSYVPVRDPKLSQSIYDKILCDMFTEVIALLSKEIQESDKITQLIHENAIDMFLEALRTWGTTSELRQRIKLHKVTLQNSFTSTKEMNRGGREQLRQLSEAEKGFSARMNQSASNYLQVCHQNDSDIQVRVHSEAPTLGVTADALFNLNYMQSYFKELLQKKSVLNQNATIAILETLSELSLMQGNPEKCIEYFLKIGEVQLLHDLEKLEDNALSSIGSRNSASRRSNVVHTDRYLHVLHIIELYDLQHSLLKLQNEERHSSRLISLIALVGLDYGARFIIKHCSLPEPDDNGRRSLPIDEIANQARPYPKILLWILHNILCEKPEVYVKFPNTAVPPSTVTDLHREHFRLLVKFADRQDIPKRKLSKIPSFNEVRKESPLLQFLKAAMPHGGIRPSEIRKTFECCRYDIDSYDDETSLANRPLKFPHLFAHELAFVMERSGKGNEEDAKKILTLYLEGVVSLPHAVEYIQRNPRMASELWEYLISYCLNTKESGKKSRVFGSLLEVSAQVSGNLSSIVARIPKKMKIQGVRKKLVNAIADYRLEVEMHNICMDIIGADKVSLLREQCHRSRRGTRVDLVSDHQDLRPVIKNEDDEMDIILRPWRDGQTRLSLKRRSRRSLVLQKKDVGIQLPSKLEIR